MRVTTSVGGNSVQNLFQKASETEKQAGKKEQKGYYAGNLNQKNTTSMQAELRRQSARKQAMKLVKDAWSWDRQAADSRQSMEKERAELSAQLREQDSIIEAATKSREQFAQENKAEPQELEDLKLLEKYQDARNGCETEEFTSEEIDRLRELQNEPRTEYQKYMLEWNGRIGVAEATKAKLEQQILGLVQSSHDAKVDQLKSQDMQNAQKASGEIMEAASDEITSMLLQDGMEQMDKKLEEQKEQAEKIQEKRQEQDEKLEKAKEERKEQQELIQQVTDAEQQEQAVSLEQQSQNRTSMEDAQSNIDKILEKNGLIEEELKGIKIDFSF